MEDKVSVASFCAQLAGLQKSGQQLAALLLAQQEAPQQRQGPGDTCSISFCGEDEGLELVPMCSNGHKIHWACLGRLLEHSLKSGNGNDASAHLCAQLESFPKCPQCRDDYLERLLRMGLMCFISAQVSQHQSQQLRRRRPLPPHRNGVANHQNVLVNMGLEQARQLDAIAVSSSSSDNSSESSSSSDDLDSPIFSLFQRDEEQQRQEPNTMAAHQHSAPPLPLNTPSPVIPARANAARPSGPPRRFNYSFRRARGLSRSKRARTSSDAPQ